MCNGKARHEVKAAIKHEQKRKAAARCHHAISRMQQHTCKITSAISCLQNYAYNNTHFNVQLHLGIPNNMHAKSHMHQHTYKITHTVTCN